MSTPLPGAGEASRCAEPTPKKKSWLSQLGPGLITGVSDDDPSGIATYSQCGAQFGYGTLWTMLVSYPLMVSIQMISAQIGRVTGQGIAANVRKFFGVRILYPLVLLLLIANIINIAADLLAMGEAAKLLVGGPILLYSSAFGVISILLQVFVPYTTYVKYLKWLTLALFTYVLTAFVVKVEWKQALMAAVLPKIEWKADYLKAFIAILGTTISPYLFFWQASEEVEDMNCHPDEKPLIRAPEQAREQMPRIRNDTLVGMACSNLVAFFIMLTTAATLHSHGTTVIDSAAQAAEALRPIAGKFSFLLFSLGIIGTGFLAVPVLAGSAAYAMGETFRWKVGLERKPMRAKEFYLVIAAASLIGLGLDFIKINPIKALIWSAVLNGVIAVPIIAVILLLASKKKVMNEFSVSPTLKVLGWATFAVMLVASVGLIITAF